MLPRGVETHPMHVLRSENRVSVFPVVTVWQLIKHYVGILFVLLFVPALNHCAIVARRMERLRAEMAVRKTFEARRSTLLNQVIWENLVLTLLGGIVGQFSWLQFALNIGLADGNIRATSLREPDWVNTSWLHYLIVCAVQYVLLLSIVTLGMVVPTFLVMNKRSVEALRHE